MPLSLANQLPMWATCPASTLSLGSLSPHWWWLSLPLQLSHPLLWQQSGLVVYTGCITWKSLTQTCHFPATASFSSCFHYSSTSLRPLVCQPLHLFLSLFSSQFTYISWSFQPISCKYPHCPCPAHSMIILLYWMNLQYIHWHSFTFPVSIPKGNLSHHHSIILLYPPLKKVLP